MITTVEEMIAALSKLEPKATIGCLTWDDEGDTWGHSEFTIEPKGTHYVKYGDKNLDYYIN